jgi:hypothetical protein
MEFWLIREKGVFGKDGAEVVEMTVIKETEKQITLSDGLCARQVKKTSLPIAIASYGIITTDREAGAKEWNRLLTSRIDRAKEDIARMERQFLEIAPAKPTSNVKKPVKKK